MAHDKTKPAINKSTSLDSSGSTAVAHLEDSPDTRRADDMDVSDEKQGHAKDDLDIRYPEPWKWEKFFIGGYNQKRMLKFKNPATMYKAINLFAGIAIMFYGYDQGVMSQVNLNEDYWNTMGINSPKTNQRNVAAEGGIVSVYYGGTLIGALIAGSLADRCGRIKAIVFGCWWALLGAVLQTSAMNIAWMCCARVIAGVGVGCLDARSFSNASPHPS